MKRIFIFAVVCLFLASPVLAVDVPLVWDPAPGALGFKIYKSKDLGQTWEMVKDVGNVLAYKLTGVEETGLILFRASAYYEGGLELIRYESGAWIDQTKVKKAPPALGIRNEDTAVKAGASE